jgi:hypothetical protein
VLVRLPVDTAAATVAAGEIQSEALH